MTFRDSFGGGIGSPCNPTGNLEEVPFDILSIPLQDWLKDPRDAREIPWKTTVGEPQLQMDQRTAVHYRATVDLKKLNPRGGDRKLVFAAGVAGDGGQELVEPSVHAVDIPPLPKGKRHQSRVDRVNDLFMDAFGKRALLRVQGPLLIDNYNLPEPDILVMRRRADFYDTEHPRPQDVFLVLEISDSSIVHDREVKMAQYAISGVSEYWIADIRQDEILIFRDPGGDTYKTQKTLHRGDTLSTLAFPDVQFKVEDILG